ncbi:polyribonucleotide nucleotidyltransferase [Chlamydia muridarum str. Nigg]|uniref:Polyribonucleotide nucleotidyltransferase n=2 Tax=Chlamydia muridarum TaxID=83560 RepID=PNP_CHLMU|nr:polyribonucleotide nucleotidyltransferase [Chlamydia muridarum]Q9PL77.1 RecName: Full=Polyribonucleotide nucleotidyltransferase; AltName: Full=Polynucleotide phosphorylase; Short=PNPase [Chlamydia muridarum str. Nigg]UFX31624.1 polyribonucleotide nucleotidyltransferase [Chlamydia trachomatis]AAF39102.1 polyribonucleotide nucleotidyltransferase [Chlamydia muridarum str. Nigg]AHH22621.1 polynucleotide phosphorylase [Chlamydia muridarum str. Nigg3 CMUT3-5]AHH23545.1 polynucleotide phosphorylas
MAFETFSVALDKDKTLIFETGKIARQANGAVLVKMNETWVFSSACAASLSEAVDFLPFRVDYQEKFSSAGKTSGGFLKREGRPSEKEILISRLIDRSLRPSFPNRLMQDIQVLSYVWSYDGKTLPDPLAICGASAALAISEVPQNCIVAGVRVGLVEGKWVVNPTKDELDASKLDLVMAGTASAVLMIEGHCDFLTEEQVLEAIAFGQKYIAKICDAIEAWQKAIGKEKQLSAVLDLPEDVQNVVSNFIREKFEKALSFRDRDALEQVSKELEESVVANLVQEESDFSLLNVKAAFKNAKSNQMRALIRDLGIRVDGRSTTEIRPISIEVSFLPRTHGSCLFTRGETQSVAVCTLGGESMAQRFEDLNGDGAARFYLQYFFPPFSVGEVGRIGSPGRREIGHGKLAEKALSHVLPEASRFPYTVRVESNITESNGSSSMASVCGGCLSLMDAGVPIKAPVAGIAMGLILDQDKAIVLSDISGIEDHLGDMDFKVAGTEEGITAFQMDIKVEGITHEIMEQALAQAKQGRSHILNLMTQVMSSPNDSVSRYAPRIETMQINTSKIATVIGPGGKQIRQIIERSGAQVDINDNGLINISANTQESIDKAKELIEGLTGEVEVGKIYNGRVTSVVAFGAFVEVLPGKEGLCHISELSKQKVDNVADFVKEGDRLAVKLLSINEKGQLKLSHKATLE